jgi:alpha-D-ribose 1-methylphosphonate 5-triphosphate synthase subunit PhnH
MQREIAYDPVFDAQEHYRLLLDVMARPGKINILPRMPLSVPAGTVLTDAAALVGFALLNADVSFCADGAGEDLATRYLLVNTSARPVALEEADFVFASGLAAAALPENMKKGSLPYPEEGATLVLSVGAMATEAAGLGAQTDHAAIGQTPPGGALAITLQGPGIAGKKTFFVRGLSTNLVEALQQSNMEFPLGVDLILTDADGRVACIPRSSRTRWEVL